MKNYILLVFIALIIVGCEKKITEFDIIKTPSSDSIIIPESDEPIESSTIQTCYIGNVEKDSVFLTIEDNLGTITGKMRYKNFEKDSSVGDIIGNQNGDTLKLNYTFKSEGITSEREIYFLMKVESLLEGIGEQKVNRHKSSYTDYSKIKYENGLNMKQIDCKDFDKKFAAK